MARLYSIYLSTGTVLGKCAASEEEAFSLIYPVTSAAAMLGVTFGCVISLVYVVIYHRINKPEYFDLRAKNTGRYKSELLSFSFPIMVSCAVQSIFQFLDTASVQAALSLIKTEDLKNAYIESISLANTADGDIITYVYGLLSSAVDFKNLIPGITMALGVCAVPAISAACSSKNNEQLALLINSVFKYTSVISMGGGIIIALCSEDILKLFYSASSPDIIAGCSALVRCFGLTAFFYSLAGTAVFCVQALGFPKKSIAPYIVSGIIRVILNILLVSNEDFILFGSVISGAAGYFVMLIWNTAIIKKQTAVKIKSRDAYIKPVFVSILSYFLLKFVFEKINFLSTAPINLLIKTALSGLIYCILCFLFKLLNFKEIFCVLKSKKMA
jgi:O-antigen/teichoic acid export membrane protein